MKLTDIPNRVEYPTHYRFRNLLGYKFGELTVVQFAGTTDRGCQWICACSCGKPTIRPTEGLSGKSGRSCGCLRKNSNLSHGHCVGGNLSPEYRAFRSSRSRCMNPNNNKWQEYGGRGIKFLFVSFGQFYAALGRKPSLIHSIDRIDNDGHYEPGNVKWSTPKEQANNRRPRTSKRNN